MQVSTGQWLDDEQFFLHRRVRLFPQSTSTSKSKSDSDADNDEVKCQWTKEICSQNTESHDDIGEFEDLPNGDALEKGSMPNPDNNDEIQAYEEVWGNLDIAPSDQPAWILRSKDENGITFVGKVGSWFQVLRKSGNGGFAVLREEKVDGKWVQRYKVGGKLPSMRELGEEVFSPEDWELDTDVQVGGVTYTVYALEKA
jgi:hypothetical protein